MVFSDDLKSIGRSWQKHFGMQFATVTVLTATFSAVVFMLSLGMSFQRVLTVWGEQIQISAYLDDGLNEQTVADLKKAIEARPEVESVSHISKPQAAHLFRDQMASYAPELMADAEFATPFPASFQIRLRDEASKDGDVARLESFAKEVGAMAGVEDVSYGQSWVRNYSSFVGVLKGAGLALGLVLLAGSLFVVANSIRTLISNRREEVEILELLGATNRHIRRPYIVEAIALCGVATLIALSVNAAFYGWLISYMKRSLAFARMAQEFSFLSPTQWLLTFACGCLLGALGSWITVRSLNSGWSAARGVQS